MVGGVLEEVKLSQEVKYAIDKVIFNKDSKVNELVNLSSINKVFIISNGTLLLSFKEY